MKVYVLEVGCYENEFIEGVYATPESAMAAHQPERNKWHSPGHSYTWRERDGDTWYFGADWGDAATITEYEVKS